ncbi:MAG: hypothetical protein ABI300_02315 [Rhodanobacter sp.]
MRFLSLMLIGPWLLVLAWVYWSWPKSLARTRMRRAFDALALLLAAATAVWMARMGYDGYEAAPVEALGRHSGAIWQHVAPALYAYGGFAAALLLAIGLRQWLWCRRPQALADTPH